MLAGSGWSPYLDLLFAALVASRSALRRSARVMNELRGCGTGGLALVNLPFLKEASLHPDALNIRSVVPRAACGWRSEEGEISQKGHRLGCSQAAAHQMSSCAAVSLSTGAGTYPLWRL